MIEIIGEKGTTEYDAAEAILNALRALWPDLENTPAEVESVKIAANVKISGYQVADIDVVICARFKKGGRRFRSSKILNDTDGRKVIGKPVTVFNLVVAVEEKSHPAKSVREIGDKINVLYAKDNKWKSATDQNIAQVHTLSKYFEDQHIGCYVHRCVRMTGLDSINVDGAVPLQFSGEELMAEIASATTVRKTRQGYCMSSGADDAIERTLSASIFRQVQPGTIDRRRMDKVAARNAKLSVLVSSLGEKMIVFRGQGGAGKTIMLLHLALRAYKENGDRTLFLTYNHALAADMRRLLVLMKVPSSFEHGGIRIETVMSFMYSWFNKTGLVEDQDRRDFSAYEDLCASSVELLESGVIDANDVSQLINDNEEKFDFDTVVVDEAQDWPQAEVNLLKALYGNNNIVIADGVDQLVRGRAANWFKGVQRDEREIVNLSRCLRMKRNLATFARALSVEADYRYELEPNPQASGGRVVLLNGSYSEHPELHDELITDNNLAGNEPIDFLFCVPPSGVLEVDGKRRSKLDQFLTKAGHNTWDAVDEAGRKDFPRSSDTFRIVQYASCRGLEGWVVVLDGLDHFWESTLQEARTKISLSGNPDDFRTVEEMALEEAWRWVFIAITRVIDTLVISVGKKDNPFRNALITVSKNMPDVVEVK
jgi:hypothetical protein